MLKYILTAAIVVFMGLYFVIVSKEKSLRHKNSLRPLDKEEYNKTMETYRRIKLGALAATVVVAIISMAI